jgi:hypothetical protein
VRSASAKRNGLTEERIDEGVDNFRESDAFSEAERIALEYSYRMQYTPDEIDDAFYVRLREHYTVPQIVELGVFIGFNIGYHTFFRTLDFYPMFSPDGRLVSQDESRRIYGDKPASLAGYSTQGKEPPNADGERR